MKTLRLFFALILSLALNTHCQGQSARLDAHGDPLPDGAIARLGSVRFRVPEGIRAFALSPCGKLLALTTDEGLRILDAQSGKDLRRMQNNVDNVYWVAFSADGKVLAGASFTRRNVTLWDPSTGALLRTLGGGKQRLTIPFAFGFSGDGKRLLAHEFGAKGAVATIWDVASGKQTHRKGLEQSYAGLSHEGRTLAIWGEVYSFDPKVETQRKWTPPSIRLWDLATGKQVQKLDIHRNDLADVLFTPDGQSAITAGDSVGVRIWDLKTGKELRRFPARPRLDSLSLSPDGKTLAAWNREGIVQLWDIASGRRLGVHELPASGSTQVRFTTDGRLIGVYSDGYSLAIWDVLAEKRLTPGEPHDAPLTSLRFADSGKTIHSLSSGGTLRCWDISTRKVTQRIRLWDQGQREKDQVQGVSSLLQPGGQFALSMSHQGSSLVDMQTRREVCVFQYETGGHSLAAGFSPDGRWLGFGGQEDREKNEDVWLYDVKNGGALRRFHVGPGSVSGVAVSTEATMVAATTDEETIHLWNIADGKRRSQAMRLGKGPCSLAFSPDSLTLAGATVDGTIRLFATRTGEPSHTLSSRDAGMLGYLAFSPDGRTLAAIRNNDVPKPGPVSVWPGVVSVWELATGTLRQQLEGHQGKVTTMAFSPDGRTLATGSEDTTVLLWDLTGQTALGKPQVAAGQLDELWKALESPDGRTGFRALSRLIAAPAETTPFLRVKLSPVKSPAADSPSIGRLIADLDSKRFATREDAMRELLALEGHAEAELEKALKSRPPLEQTKRIDKLLAALRTPLVRPELVRPLRAIEVLERIDSTESRQVLQTLAGGDSQMRLTREARTALQRLGKPVSAAP